MWNQSDMSLTWNLILLFLSAASVVVSWTKSKAKTQKALKMSLKSFINVLPFLVAIFILIGMMEVFVPQSVIVFLMGKGRGLLAPVLAALIGGILTGPPAASYPMAEFMMKHQASTAAVATFLIAWVAVGTVSLPLEIKLLGPKFAWIRWSLTLVLSILIGILLGWLL